MKSHLCLEKPLQQEIWQGLTLLQYLLTQQEMEFLVTNLQCINAKESHCASLLGQQDNHLNLRIK